MHLHFYLLPQRFFLIILFSPKSCLFVSLHKKDYPAQIFALEHSAWLLQECTTFVECRWLSFHPFMWFKAVRGAKQQSEGPDRRLDMTMKLEPCRKCSACWLGTGSSQCWASTGRYRNLIIFYPVSIYSVYILFCSIIIFYFPTLKKVKDHFGIIQQQNVLKLSHLNRKN